MTSVLLLDDDRDLRRLLALGLQPYGVRVFEAGTARQADELLRLHAIQLVVVDGLLPDDHGIAFLERLRERDREVRGVFISSHFRDLATIHHLANDLDIAHIFYKPIDAKQVAAQIADLLHVQKQAALVSEYDLAAPVDPFQRIRQEFAAQLADKLREIENAIAACRDGRIPIAEPRMLAHRLRGSAGSYGYHAIGEAIGAVETLLVDTIVQGTERRFLWEHVADALHDAKVAATLESPRAGEHEVAPRRILLLSRDTEFVQLVSCAARKSLSIVQPVAIPAEALEHVQREPFLSIVVDAGFSESESIALVRGIRAFQGKQNVPIAFASSDRRMELRVAAVRAGVTRFFEKPISEAAFCEVLRQLLSEVGGTIARVLIVDDDPDIVRFYTASLGAANFVVDHLASADGLVDKLEDSRTDVLLLDVSLPHVSGIDLCRALRMSERWELLPIIIITASLDRDTRLRAFRAGASDVITKPVLVEELLTRVRAQEERARLLRDRADKDALSGLLLRRALVEAFQRVLGICSRDRKPLSLVLFDLDHFKRVNDTHGHLAGDRVIAAFGELLRQRFRVEDLRARWGGEEFLLVLPGARKDFAAEAGRRLLEDFAALEFVAEDETTFHSTFTAGIAEYPLDGTSMAALLKYADEMLYSGKRAGRNCVVANTAQSEAEHES